MASQRAEGKEPNGFLFLARMSRIARILIIGTTKIQGSEFMSAIIRREAGGVKNMRLTHGAKF